MSTISQRHQSINQHNQPTMTEPQHPVFDVAADGTRTLPPSAPSHHTFTPQSHQSFNPLRETAARAIAIPVPSANCLLSEREQLAASLDALNTLSPTEIAHAAGLTARQFRSLRQTAPYRDHIRQILQIAIDSSRTSAIATRAGRLSHLQRRHDLLSQIIDERAASYDPRYADPNDQRLLNQQSPTDPSISLAESIDELGTLYDSTNPINRMIDPSGYTQPGTSTGLLTKTLKSIGAGLGARLIEEWSVDTSILNEMRLIERRAAEEAGQLLESSHQQEPTLKLYVNIDMDKI